MRRFVPPVGIVFCVLAFYSQAAQPQIPFNALEIDRFAAAPGVNFPIEYQTALVDDVAREVSVEFPTIKISRESNPASDRRGVLRISGTVIKFTPGSSAKRKLIGFGAGATVIDAQVRFTSASTNRIVLIRDLSGTTWAAITDGDFRAAADSLGKRIARLCKDVHLLDSN